MVGKARIIFEKLKFYNPYILVSPTGEKISYMRYQKELTKLRK